jgi:hypothetical protein
MCYKTLHLLRGALTVPVMFNCMLGMSICFGQTPNAGQQDWLTPEALAMPREQISRSLPDSALRLYTGRGYVSLRDMTVTGIQRLSFPPVITREYRFNLAFREEATGVLIQDLQDEGGDPLYYNLSGPCNRLGPYRGGPDGISWVLLAQDATWQPNCVTRTGTCHKYYKGQMISFGVKSRTSLSSDADEIYEELELTNRMERPLVLTLIPDQHASPRAPSFDRTIAGAHVVAVSDAGKATSDGWRVTIPPKSQRAVRIGLLVLQAAKRTIPAGYYMPDLAARIEKGQAATRQLLRWAAERLPRVDTQNKALDEFYRRCILTVLNCRWDRENLCSRPFYDFGWREGLSVTWDTSFASEMLSILEPAGLKTAFFAFFHNGISNCTWMYWHGGGMGYYAQHPVAVMRILTDYVRQTGDLSILDHVERDATILEWLKRLAREWQTKFARPDGLLDFGENTTALLEIRTSGYEHVVAATNSMAADYYRSLAQFCRLHNDRDADQFQTLADRLQKAVNEKLWNERLGWFENLYPDNSRQFVLSYHLFDVLDGQTVPPDRKRRLAAWIKEGEFLGPYGMFSIARSDQAHWDREDCDFGGGGQYIGQPLRVAESLYRMGENEKAWDVLSRCVRWIERFPYFPQAMYTDDPILQPHQIDYPQEISAGSGVQAVVFGMFGLRPQADGALEVSPAYNSTLGDAKLTGYRFRGHTYDVSLMPNKFAVCQDGKKVGEQAYGHSVRLLPSPPPKPMMP